ncbi:MAG: efflux transporter outer membrane subunit [Acidobacteriota bacterium]
MICATAGLLVTACVQAPPRQPPDAGLNPPARWMAGAGAAAGPPEDESTWWTDLGDARLDGVIATALRENHDLGAAAARLEQAVAQARMTRADLKPFLSGTFDFSRQRFNFIGFPIPGGFSRVLSTTSSRYDVGVDLGWDLDLWGRLRAGARAALAEVGASEADLYGARLSISGEAARAWFAVVEASEQVALARDTVASRRILTEQIRARFARGLRPAIELRLAASNLAAAEALLAQRLQEKDGALRRLDLLMGRYPAASFLPAGEPPHLPRIPQPVPAALPADLIARRPDLVGAERRLAAADARAVAARRALFPSLTLTGSGGTASNQLRDLVDGDFRVWSLLAGLTQPLFAGGKLRAGVHLADASVREAREQYVQTALTAYAQVEASLAAGTFLAEREAHETESARQLTAARRLAEERYAAGVGDYLTVLDSQTRELATRGDVLRLRRLRLDNRIDLHLALGGGFDIRTGRTGTGAPAPAAGDAGRSEGAGR